ncbi:hypothetical protein [Streptomyces pluripotens]|nr:hypothetical protein [Streptomyces pluripotens]
MWLTCQYLGDGLTTAFDPREAAAQLRQATEDEKAGRAQAARSEAER